MHNDDLIDDGVHPFVLVEITKDGDWRVVERYEQQPELFEHIALKQAARNRLRAIQVDMRSQKSYLSSPRLKIKIDHWFESIDELLRGGI